MPAADRPPSFQFYPREFLASRAVIAMTPEARGGYILLLCHAWLSNEPGVLPDDDELLAALSGLGQRWSDCRSAIRRAFAERSLGDSNSLVQERMVETREIQRKHYESSAKGARVTNAKRWGSVASDKSATRKRVSERRPSSASSSASAGESKAKESAPSGTPPPAGLLPTNKTGVPYPVSHEQLAAWVEAYPAVDVRQQLRQMRAWLEANPSRRKTARGMPAFVTRWLGKEQDRPGAKAANGADEPTDPYTDAIFQVGEAELDELARKGKKP